MMKKNLMRLSSLLQFELPLSYNHLSLQFSSEHQKQLLRFPTWSLQATKKQIIARYWFCDVVLHFIFLFGTAAVFTVVSSGRLDLSFIPASILSGGIAFLILFILNYWPSYYLDFLPKLDSLVDEQQKKERFFGQQQLLVSLQEMFAIEYDQIAREREDLAKQRERLEFLQKEIVKCRKAQLHTLSLALVVYAFDKTTGINFLRCDDQSAALLTKLFGKDPGGIKDALQLIFGKKQELTPRLRTEIQNRFSEAYTFFEELGFNKGISLLQTLESKFTVSS